MQLSNELRSMIARRRPGYSLEAPFYRDKDIFELDMAAIFGRTWIYVGCEPDIPEPGDYFTVPLGKTSIVVARDDDMSITAFHNVCRHRGARLCDGAKGSVGNVVCPYHQWTYGLDGRLANAQRMGASFDAATHGLKPIHVQTVAGTIYVCLAEAAPLDPLEGNDPRCNNRPQNSAGVAADLPE